MLQAEPAPDTVAIPVASPPPMMPPRLVVDSATVQYIQSAAAPEKRINTDAPRQG